MTTDFSLGGKILHIDLTRRAVTTEPTAPYGEKWLGGMGISAWKLLRDTGAGVSPLDPESILAFNAGVLVGTMAPAACRIGVVSGNVLTGGFGSANAGGNFAPELKYAGYDQIIVTGRAKNPVYVAIDDDTVTIEDAAPIWGKTTGEVEDYLGRTLANDTLEVLSIGPAGENLVRAANIIVNRARSASRCGVGAVMGAKNLKAIAVSGSGQIAVADPEGFMDACAEMTKILVRGETTKAFRALGTPASFHRWNELGTVPNRNYQRTQMDADKVVNLAPDRLREHITRSFGCFACPLHCTQFQHVTEGPYAGAGGEKIEGENLHDFGARLDIDNLAAIIKASNICKQLGLDTANVSGAIAWAFECFQRGILTVEDTGGMRLEWGDHRVLVDLLGKIARCDGIGALLAKGSREAARSLGRGSEAFAIHVKGQDLAEELRVLKAWGLGVVVAERGGSHTSGSPLTERMAVGEDVGEELFGVPTAFTPDTYEGKAKLVVYYQRFHAALECLGSCFFSSNWYGPHALGPHHFAILYSLATGRAFTADDLMAMGERVHTLQKMFNVRHAGFGRAHDYPPDRMLAEPASGSPQGPSIDRADWDRLLDDYYDLHGWDRTSGQPTEETLHGIGLDELVGLL